jgi:hypothetical protein
MLMINNPHTSNDVEAAVDRQQREGSRADPSRPAARSIRGALPPGPHSKAALSAADVSSEYHRRSLTLRNPLPQRILHVFLR